MSTVRKQLETRVYRAKDKSKEFYCPLCATLRVVTVKPKLTTKNYIQIFLTSIVLGFLLFPLMKAYAFLNFFFIWGVFELIVRSDFKHQLPCPHCGFDASVYKRDVKQAKLKVKEFWNQKSKA